MKNNLKSVLPTPDNAAIAHSNQLKQSIIDQINHNGGAISFEQFMHDALYTKGLGYYSSELRKFGETGDFVTAPEISPLFSRCLAHQCVQLFEKGDILEFGAGSGEMALRILTELQSLNALPQHYFIIEVSENLKQRQQEKLQDFLSQVVWLDQLPERFEGVVLANEVLDAMPVRKFQIGETNEILEYFVTTKNDQFEWILKPADESLETAVKNLNIDFPPHYSSEINIFISGWLKNISEMLMKGVVLLIDYGFPQKEYYHLQRDRGTLMCHYRHYAHDDPFFYVGLQDITAHVDFTAVAKGAEQAGFNVLGYTSQGDFLLQGGLLQLITNFEELPLQQRLKFAQQMKQLTLPHEMGELFKVIGLSKNISIQLPAFKNNRSFVLY